ncbi:MAG: PKD domain-containing protein [Methanomicrobiales archaeon]|nr:PKD domain-containing protein [Methanomicrobiales archaeon]
MNTFILLVLALLIFPVMAGTGSTQDQYSLSREETVSVSPGSFLPFTPSFTPGGYPRIPLGWSSLTRSKALLSSHGAQSMQTGGNGADPLTEIDETLAPAETAALKSVIQNTLHAFSYDASTDAWTAHNYANQVTFTYTRDGTAGFSDGEHSFGLALLGIGRGGDLISAEQGVAHADGRLLNITRTEFTEWYKNNDEGLEQGVTIARRPPGNGHIQVGFALTDDGSFSIKDGQTLTVTDVSGTSLFTYTGLVALSADGKKLPASLMAYGSRVHWIVDDADAIYPVTIDPVITASAATAKFTGAGKDDYFGSSVALNQNGQTVLIGAYYNSSERGTAYLFERPAGGWNPSTSASAATTTFTGAAVGDQFGFSIALNETGGVALVGAPLNDHYKGAAYLFERPAGGWNPSTSASAATTTFTGAAVGDRFGMSVALNKTGGLAFVGAPFNASSQGAAYLFERPAGGWDPITSASAATATFTDAAGSDWFGWSVALNETGGVALVGAPNKASYKGAAYLFERPAGGWNPITSTSAATATFTGTKPWDNFGGSVALNQTGGLALIGASQPMAGNGTAYLFEKPAGGWNPSSSEATVNFIGAADGDNFGMSVALNKSGQAVIIGAVKNTTASGKTGTAYLFERPAGGWILSTSALDATATFTGGAASDEFGRSVALNETGGIALVGALYNESGGRSCAGAAYLFEVATPGPTPSPPTAIFSGTPTSGTAPLTVTFTDTSTGDAITSRLWDFGEGNPPWPTTHTSFTQQYTNAGTYSVNLTVTNAAGSDSLLRPGYITVTSPPSPDPGPGPVDVNPPGVKNVVPPAGSPGSSFTTTVTGFNFMFGVSPIVTFTHGGTTGGKTTTKSFKATHVKVITSSKLTCHVKVPSDTKPGTYTVTVKNGDGQAGSLSNAFTVTSLKPVVSSLSPDKGVAGKTVTITSLAGRNFYPNAKVFLKRDGANAIAARNVKVISPQKITCLFSLPAGTTKGKWDVVVRNPDSATGEKDGAFTVR